MRTFYTQNGWEGRKYEITRHLGISELNKLIRSDLKESFPKCKFKVVKQDYNSITIWIIENISGLTDKELAREIRIITNNYNYDDSDSQIDYFDTNFYLSIYKEGDNIYL